MKHLVLAFVVAALPASPSAQEPLAACQVSSTAYGQSPAEPDADPVIGDWYMNDTGTIRVAVPHGGWNAGGRVYRGNHAIKGQKSYWVRPRGTTLTITGHRLDGQAAAVEADVPCCYYPSGFQIVALHFPAEGCWAVRATSGDHQLSFVTQVQPARRGQ